MSTATIATILLLGVFLVLVFLRVPVVYAIGVASLLDFFYLGINPMQMALKFVSNLNSYTLLAVPFFILMGELMSAGGITDTLIAFSKELVGWMRGGAAMVNVVASFFFGGISGSSSADCASLGPIEIKMMEEQGYDREFSTCLTMASSVEGILVPPSQNMVIFTLAAAGVTTVSIGQLFVAGYMPGAVLSIVLMIYSYYYSKKMNIPVTGKFNLKNCIKAFFKAIWGMLAVMFVVVGVIAGVFTTTESAAAAVVWSLCVGLFIYKASPSRISPTSLQTSWRLWQGADPAGRVRRIHLPADLSAHPHHDRYRPVLHHQQQDRHPDPAQHPDAVPGLPDRDGLPDPDADPRHPAHLDAAGSVPHPSGHRHGAEPRHRPADPSRRLYPVHRLCHFRHQDRDPVQEDGAVLHHHVHCADNPDLLPADLHVAAEPAVLSAYGNNESAAGGAALDRRCSQRPQRMILICPGGGYQWLSPREAQPVAHAFTAAGWAAAVVYYTIREKPGHPPLGTLPVRQLGEALQTMQQRFPALSALVCGFSAGGHLAASLGVHWRELGLPRPDGMILGYPVITAGKYAHRGSIQNLAGSDDPGWYSLETQVTADTPPAFFWHTVTDPEVPVQNSLLLAGALSAAGVRYEMHLYPRGVHGLSLATPEVDEPEKHRVADPHIAGWFGQCLEWLDILKTTKE